MAVTRSNIATRALRKLGAIGLGQNPDAVRHNVALQVYDELYQEMLEHGLVKWGLTDDVPNEYSFHVISLVAFRLSNEIAIPVEKYQRIAIDAASAESEIRRIKTDNYIQEETKVSDF